VPEVNIKTLPSSFFLRLDYPIRVTLVTFKRFLTFIYHSWKCVLCGLSPSTALEIELKATHMGD
jgi:hypothetical protein